MAEETDNNTSKSTGNSKKVLNLEVNEFLGADIAVLTPYQELRLLFSGLETIHLTRVASDVFVPPKRFS
ncbi:MAG: hypothetical protein Q8909_19950 [Bacteroidota bacterium]|nr:hypothetical protein [Bacteroidota bacterium]